MSGASFASFAIRSSFVEMVTELGVSFIVPSSGSVFRCRSLLRRVPWVGSPASSLLLRHSDSSPPVHALLRCLRSAVPSRRRRRRGLPGSWTSLACMPCCITPAESMRTGPRACPILRRIDVAFRVSERVGLREKNHFGASFTACMLAVYASQPRSLARHARLASGWWPFLGRSGLSPAGCCVRFQLLHGILLTQACLAHPR